MTIHAKNNSVIVAGGGGVTRFPGKCENPVSLPQNSKSWLLGEVHVFAVAPSFFPSVFGTLLFPGKGTDTLTH
jgi:hypothetical protein